ncbi:signal peptide protein [Rhodopirellula sallentina SM41]|uniref:Signal peptide protein n=2 Tax=Rhodopirellula TaxID=265488 RepID=M5TYZ6_9BACT|nr:signal peptide protein [Rhodopirellula sallentina SM41]
MAVAMTVCPAARAEEGTDSVMEKLQGVWNVTRGVSQGEDIPKKDLKGTKMKIEDNVIVTYDADENEKYRASFSINSSVQPIAIDMETKTKGMPPMKSLGIVKLSEGNGLKLCYALPGVDRPAKFQSKEGEMTMLFMAKKESATKSK